MFWDQAREMFHDAMASTSCKAVEWTPPKASGYALGLTADQPVSGGTVKLYGENPQAPRWAFLSCSGSSAPWGFDLASRYPGAQVNRLDVAYDFYCDQKVFERAFNKARATLHADNRQTQIVESFSKTLYMNWQNKPDHMKAKNHAKPEVTARLYEKGKTVGVDEQDPNWRRFEIEYRPDKKAYKERALSLTVDEVIGLRPWTRAIAAQLGYDSAVMPERLNSIYAEDGPVSENVVKARLLRTHAQMSSQYRRMAQQMAEVFGRKEAERLLIMGLFDDEVPHGFPTGADAIMDMAQQHWAGVFADPKKHH